jgi:magnesium-transporting ATPase (P-type)
VQSIRRAILLNNDVSMQAEDPREGGHFENIDGVERIVNYSYEPKGNSIEVGMVKMLDVNPESDISQQLGEMKNKYPLQMIQPFDQALKTMITIHMDTENEQILITMKGAPENVLKACVMGYDQNGEEVEMGEDDPEGQELSVRQ